MTQPYRKSGSTEFTAQDRLRDLTVDVGTAHLCRMRALQRRDLAIEAFVASEKRLDDLTQELHHLTWDEARRRSDG